MRAGGLIGMLIWLVLGLALLAGPREAAVAAPASSTGCGNSCGLPDCWQPSVRVRPDMTLNVRVQCLGLTAARLISPPAHSEVSNITTDWASFSFDVRPDPNSPRFDEAVFEVTGHAGSIDLPVPIEVVPTAENSPPICSGDRVIQRSSGTAPVDVFMHPWCRDPDGDQFVMRGGPPGVHLDSPTTVQAGTSESNWHYRTATFSGTETSTVWATDVLGARSEDATLEVTVGPEINRPPECTPSSWGSTDDVHPIYSRPGAIRRFAILCQDPDGDAFNARISSPPQRGTIPLFLESGPSSGYWGSERWIDATYAPVTSTLDPDPFSVTASGPGESGSPSHLAIVPRALPTNGGGSCGWSGAGISKDLPGKVSLTCDDGDGDPLSAQILTEPKHGIAAPAVVTPAAYGQSDISIPYVPAPGYEGYDCIEVRVTDGHGLEFEISLDIWVRTAPPPMTFEPLPLPPLPDLPIIGKSGKRTAEQALGTKAVERVKTGTSADVWARKELSREDLEQFGRAPGMVVVCSEKCDVRSGAGLAPATRSLRRGRAQAVSASEPGSAQVLSLAISPKERRTLRRAASPRGKFRVRIRESGVAGTSVSRSIPVGP